MAEIEKQNVEPLESEEIGAPEPEIESHPPVVEQPKPAMSFVQKPTEIAQSARESISRAAESFKTFTTTNSGMTILFLVIGILAAFVIAYVLYWIINKTVNSRTKYMMKASAMPIVCTSETVLTDDSNIPNPDNGVRMSMTFWIYIYDINKYLGSTRHIFHRGKETDDYTTASPYVYLDPNSNKLSVTFAPTVPAKLLTDVNGVDYTGNSRTTTYVAGSNYLTDSDSILKACTLLRGITIDYVPVQRWVHIGIVVNEEVNGGVINAYVDGEIVKSATTLGNSSSGLTLQNNTVKAWKAATTTTASSTLTTPSTIQLGLNLSGANLGLKGNVYVGGSPGSAVGPGFSGMISKLTFYNYDLNAQDVYNEYLSGPINNLLAQMGLPAYGLQSPIYRIDGANN